jgi:signal transduction histidine kinase
MKTRVSSLVNIHINIAKPGNWAKINVPLFDWVLENLSKNAIDAMNGKGELNINISHDAKFVYIDIHDTGKGIPKSKFNTVFKPGFTTKKRGWGLGLSLVKRIVEGYHKGKIFVRNSEAGKGTTFRIMLHVA